MSCPVPALRLPLPLQEDPALRAENRQSIYLHRGKKMQVKKSFFTLPGRLLMLAGILALLALVVVQVTPASAASLHQATPSWQNNAFVRVVHASPRAGTVDVFVDGKKLLNDFRFGSVTGYVALEAGKHRIQVAPDGKGRGASVIDETVAVEAGVWYTVAAIGTKASGFSLQAFVDNNRVADGKAKVRVYHLSPNAGPVNVAVGGETVIKGLTYRNASDYLSVAPGSYTFKVTAVQANATVPVSATLRECTVNSVFAVGLFEGSPALQFVLASVKSASCDD
jgi:hypothetical protein